MTSAPNYFLLAATFAPVFFSLRHRRSDPAWRGVFDKKAQKRRRGSVPIVATGTVGLFVTNGKVPKKKGENKTKNTARPCAGRVEPVSSQNLSF